MKKLFLRTFSKLFIVTLVLNLFIGMNILAAEETEPHDIFNDVEKNIWYEDTLGVVIAKGIIAGYPDGTFKGTNEMTVDQFIKAMVVALEGEQPLGTDYWASQYIAKAKELGIIKENMFTDYTGVITRAKMALIAENTMSQLEGSYNYKYTDLIQLDINDIQAVNNSGHATAIVHMYEQGILKGYPDGEYKPDSGLKRQEAITVILRVIDKRYRTPYNYYSDYPEEIQEIIEELDLHPMEQTDTGIIVTPENVSTLPDTEFGKVYMRDKITIYVTPESEYTTIGDYNVYIGVNFSSVYKSKDPEKHLKYMKYMFGKILKEYARLEDEPIKVLVNRYEELYHNYAYYEDTLNIIHYNDGYTEVKDAYGRTMVVLDGKSNNAVRGILVRGLYVNGNPFSGEW